MSESASSPQRQDSLAHVVGECCPVVAAAGPADETRVETAAKAIYEHVRSKAGNQNWPAWDERDEHQRKSWLTSARAALDAVVEENV